MDIQAYLAITFHRCIVEINILIMYRITASTSDTIKIKRNNTAAFRFFGIVKVFNFLNVVLVDLYGCSCCQRSSHAFTVQTAPEVGFAGSRETRMWSVLRGARVAGPLE